MYVVPIYLYSNTTSLVCQRMMAIIYWHPGNLAEEQRALATLGRTYFVHSQSELEKGGEKATKLLRQASLGYQRSLDVCDKLIGQISDREVLEMKSRLYLNLGLVYETRSDTKEARKFMEKALSIGK